MKSWEHVALQRVGGSLIVLVLAMLAAGGPLDAPAGAQSSGRCLLEVDGLFPQGPAGGTDAVLMIHGWAGAPGSWTAPIDVSVNRHNQPPGRTLVDQVRRIQDTDVWLLDYEVYSRRWVTDVNVGGRVGAAIDCLADAYQRPIGVMAHSMGGLAMRQALADDETRTDRVAGLVTFGTPHLGSDVAAALAQALGLTRTPGLDLPTIRPAHVQLLRTCGLLSGLIDNACWPLPAQIAAFDSPAGQALRTESTELAALPPLPPDLPVASLAGDLELVNQVSTGLFYQDLGRLRVGDAVVTRPSATAAGTETQSWDCRYNLRTLPAASDSLRNLFGVGFDAGTERALVAAPNSACLHWKLMRAQEPTNYAIGFMQERLSESIDGPTDLIDGAVGDAAAQQARAGISPIQLLIDVSGSMNERDAGGTVRLDGARTAITDMLFELPSGTPVGVRYYPDAGGRCDPGRSLVPVGPLDASRASAAIDTLQADGGTPTGPALQAAVDALRADGYESGELVLVSDGESNCGEPPCEVAGAIVAEGFDVSVHAVGFETSQAGREELSCISNATGGTYVDVDDHEQLTEQLVALSGARLELAIEQPETVPSGLQLPIEVRIDNNSAHDAADVQVTLGFEDAGPETIIPAVRPPRFRVGNVPAGQSVTRSWDVTAGAAGESGTARSRATAWGPDLAAVSATGQVTITPGLPSVSEAGDVLRDVRTNAGRVAILGDSYSSGEGAGDYLPGTDEPDNRCHRSHRTHGSALYGSDTVDLIACSGAVIQDLYSPQSGRAGVTGQLRQLEQLDRLPNLVLLTLGGNDIGFSSIIKRCVKPGDCSTDYPFVIETLQNIEGLQPALRRAYREISWTVEHSPVVVMGYPVALPYADSASCTGFNANEVVFGNHVVRELNRAIERAVVTVRDEGFDVRYVPQTAQSMLPTNTACHADPHLVPVDLVLGLLTTYVDWASGTQADLAEDRWWIMATTEGTAITQQLMHPNQSGYRSMAHALVRWSQNYEGPDEPLVPPPDTRPPRLEVRNLPQRTVNLEVEDSVGVRQGDRLELQAGGFAPGSDVTLRVRSNPIALASVTVDADGDVAADVTVPSQLPLGVHQIEALGHDGEARTLLVSREAEVRSPRPDFLLPLWAGSGIALLAGVMALGLLRHERRRMSR